MGVNSSVGSGLGLGVGLGIGLGIRSGVGSGVGSGIGLGVGCEHAQWVVKDPAKEVVDKSLHDMYPSRLAGMVHPSYSKSSSFSR